MPNGPQKCGPSLADKGLADKGRASYIFSACLSRVYVAEMAVERTSRRRIAI
jgi:hypothetical protein